MASVSSLDRDLRNMRLEKYTPRLAKEAREWIEEVLGERLKAGDLLDALKSGVALCKLMNLAIGSPGLRYKDSTMPFVQMENISHFLKACQSPPINLPPHDVFLTVDLYEAKDPAQVLQCLGAFSRRASAIQPARFPRALGKIKAGVISPQSTGTSHDGYTGPSNATYQRTRGTSNASETSTSIHNPPSQTFGGKTGPMKNGGTTSPSGGTSSWSKRADEGATMPAWNIAQYGYMGGASQGNQGITFGGRRQITTPAPKVPSLAEKERKRREEEAETERLRIQAEEAEHKRRVQRAAEEERDRIAEERRWEEETRKQREKERKEVEEEKLRWEEEERRWKNEEEQRLREEKELEAHLEKERQRKRAGSDARLKGQFLSQYQAEQGHLPMSTGRDDPARTKEHERVKDLERQLEEAKERERQYVRERQGSKLPSKPDGNISPSISSLHRSTETSSNMPEQNPWQGKVPQQDLLQSDIPPRQPPRPLPDPAEIPPLQPPRPLPTPQSTLSHSFGDPPSPFHDEQPSLPARPLPDPTAYTPNSSRTDRFLSTNPAPTPRQPTSHLPSEASHSTTSEKDAETARRLASQTKTKAGGFAAKSILEREMENERIRQKEWEEAQKATKDAAQRGVKAGGSGPGESWDVHQYGYMGGDSQNKVGPGLGGRRQILGPRPPR
ncbi:hypothetical protein MMC26_002045 [Xylographa opegraphella]|nr:hypothetical protein [Xylographa opegraphella]